MDGIAVRKLKRLFRKTDPDILVDSPLVVAF